MSETTTKPSGGIKILLFTLVTLLILFFAVEGIWRVVCLAGLSIPPSGDRSLDREWDWVVTTRADGKHPITEGPYRYDPVLGWGLLQGFHKDNIHINKHGQRGLVDWQVEKPAGIRRIMALGDSYTYGYDVGDQEAYPAVLGSLLGDGFEVINWGVPGYGTDQQVLLYEKYGISFSPDIVILGFYTPDLFRNRLTFFSYLKPCYELQGDQLHLAAGTIHSPTELLETYNSGQKQIRTDGFYSLAYLRRELEDMRRDHVDPNTLEWPVTQKILEHFSQIVRGHGATPLLLIIPDKEILKKEESATTDIANLLTELAEKLGMPCLDMIPIIRAKASETNEPLYKGHWTPFGHQIAAEELLKALREKGLL